MTAKSTAIAVDQISRVVGYKLKAVSFVNQSPNLPQRIAVFGEANTANQSTIDITAFKFTNAKAVGDKYGYGSPLHQIARILRPINADLLGGIETVIYPQLEAAGAAATVIKSGIAVATNVTETAVHTIVISGREQIDGGKYSYTVTKGEDAAAVRATIIDTVNNVLGSPVSAVESTNDIDFTTKWKGITSVEVNISFETNGKDAGIVYSEVSKTDGSGAADITASLALFQTEWNTLLINPYGSTEFDELEAFNGVPDPDSPTGRYSPEIFKPLMALFGWTGKTKSGVLAVTDLTARKSQVTNVLCPAPNSKGTTWEAAANMAVSFASVVNEDPHLGNGGKSYYDMPIPSDGDIGDFANYADRNDMLKGGSSTVTLKAGVFQIEDFATTYHPDGEVNPKYRYCRDLNLNWNIEFGWRIIMERDIQDKTIVGDDSPVRVGNTIAPKQAKQLAFSYVDDLQARALINDADFSKSNTDTGINESNPARMDINFKYKITSTANVVSTDAEFDFTYSF